MVFVIQILQALEALIEFISIDGDVPDSPNLKSLFLKYRELSPALQVLASSLLHANFYLRYFFNLTLNFTR